MSRFRQISLLSLILILSLAATVVGWMVERQRLIKRIDTLEAIILHSDSLREIESFINEQKAMASPVIIEISEESD